MPISEFDGRELASDGEEHRHECEVRWVLDKLTTSEARHRHVFGAQHRDDLFRFDQSTGKMVPRDDRKPDRMSIYAWRGLEAADRIMNDAIKLHELRKARRAAAPQPDTTTA